MTPRPFADAAPIYRALGWAGTLPLPPKAKNNPPDGWSGGKHPFDPSDAQVVAWAANGYGVGNLALRLPVDIIGIDVDAYDTWRPAVDPATGQQGWKLVRKRGAQTLAELEATLGPLPATWRSSARPAPSGIRLFRVPSGFTITESNLPGDIEVIRRGHRYVVAPPSWNPDAGAEYGWTYGVGQVWRPAAPPRVDAVPELPGAWAVRLASRPDTAPVLDEFWRSAKTPESAAGQWRRLHERVVGFVRRCEMFGWGGDAHGQLLEMTRELAQLAPAHAHTAIGQWFAEGGAGFVDGRVRAMVDSALGKYPADKIVAPDRGKSGVVADPYPGTASGTTNTSPGSVDQHRHASRSEAGPGSGGSGPTPGTLGADRSGFASQPPDRPAESNGSTAAHPSRIVSSTNELEPTTSPRRLPMIPDVVWNAYGWTRSIRAQARAADVCPDAVLGSMLATYAARVPPGVRIVTGTKMPLGTNLVVALVGPSGSDKSTSFTLAQKISPGSAVPVVNNPGSGEAFAATFVHPDPDGEGSVTKRAKVLKPDPRALFYVSEGALVGQIGSRLGSTWLPHLRALAVDESLSTTNATSEINRQVPAQSYSAGVVIGFQPTTAGVVLHDTGTGTAQRFLWFTSLSTEDLPAGAGLDAPNVPMAVPVITRLGAGLDEENRPIHYLTVTAPISALIRAEQRHARLTRDITATDDHEAHRHTLVAKLAALAVLADGRVLIEEGDWAWASALYAASAAVRDELLSLAEDVEARGREKLGQDMARTDRARRTYDSAEARVADVILRALDRRGGVASRGELSRSVSGRDKGLVGSALDQLETHGYVRQNDDGKYHRVQS